MRVCMTALAWPWFQPSTALRVKSAPLMTSEEAELIWASVSPTLWFPSSWMVEEESEGRLATRADVIWNKDDVGQMRSTDWLTDWLVDLSPQGSRFHYRTRWSAGWAPNCLLLPESRTQMKGFHTGAGLGDCRHTHKHTCGTELCILVLCVKQLFL